MTTYRKVRGRHEHRIIGEEIVGRPLLPGEIVHHEDRNPRNNAKDNLRVVASQAEHIREHHPEMLAARKVKHGY